MISLSANNNSEFRSRPPRAYAQRHTATDNRLSLTRMLILTASAESNHHCYSMWADGQKSMIQLTLTVNATSSVNGTPTQTDIAYFAFGNNVIRTADVVSSYNSGGSILNRYYRNTTIPIIIIIVIIILFLLLLI
jgi:hypothetical protein